MKAPRIGQQVGTPEAFLRLPEGTLLRDTRGLQYEVQGGHRVGDLVTLGRAAPGDAPTRQARDMVVVSDAVSMTVLALPPGECGDCVTDFRWDHTEWRHDGPVMVCRLHGLAAPGWVYEYEDTDRLPTAGTVYLTPDGAVYRLTEYVHHPEPTRDDVVALYDVLRPGRGMAATDSLPDDAREVWRP